MSSHLRRFSFYDFPTFRPENGGNIYFSFSFVKKQTMFCLMWTKWRELKLGSFIRVLNEAIDTIDAIPRVLCFMDDISSADVPWTLKVTAAHLWMHAMVYFGLLLAYNCLILITTEEEQLSISNLDTNKSMEKSLCYWFGVISVNIMITEWRTWQKLRNMSFACGNTFYPQLSNTQFQ